MATQIKNNIPKKKTYVKRILLRIATTARKKKLDNFLNRDSLLIAIE